MAAPSHKVHFQVTQNNGGIDLSIEVGSQVAITLSLDRSDLEDMLERISLAIDDADEPPES